MADGAIVEMEFSTGVWTENTDILLSEGLYWDRGIDAVDPTVGVATPGALHFVLDNKASNSGAKDGYYSPGHANVRSGFGFGMSARLKITSGATSWYHFFGTLKTIDVEAGTTGQGRVFCTVVDYMDKLSETKDLRLVLRENYTVDQALTDVVGQVNTAPQNTDYDTGSDNLLFLFDDLGSNIHAMTVCSDLMATERGFLSVRGNATDGETLRMESRKARAVATSDETFVEGELIYDDGIVVPSMLERVVNIADAAAFPRSIATSVAVVQLEEEVLISAGQSVDMWVDYRDPSNSAEYVGADAVVTPLVATTDFTANDTAGGGGVDITTDFSGTVSAFASRCKITITNNGAIAGYVRGPGSTDGLQVRGNAILRYAAVEKHAENAASIALYDQRPLPNVVDMPYQGDVNVAQSAADFIANVRGGIVNVPTVVRPNTAVPSIMERSVDRDIGDRITVSETRTAVSAVDVHIMSVHGRMLPNRLIEIEWGVAPADMTDVLILDSAVSGILDSNRLSY